MILDVVQRYDVDGDPHRRLLLPVPGADADEARSRSPTTTTWQALPAAPAASSSRDDWRREAVNTLRRAACTRSVEDGEAAGEGRHQPVRHLAAGPSRRASPGSTSTTQLYADAQLWLQRGLGRLLHAAALLADRAQPSRASRSCWSGGPARTASGATSGPGLSLSSSGDDAGALEVVNQIMVARGMAPGGPRPRPVQREETGAGDAVGQAGRGTVRGGGAGAALSVDRQEAADAAEAVREHSAKPALQARWTPEGSEPAFLWVVYTKVGGRWRHEILPGSARATSWPLGAAPVRDVAVTAVDRNGNESRRARCTLQTGARCDSR